MTAKLLFIKAISIVFGTVTIDACPLGLGACAAGLGLPGRLVLSDLLRAGDAHIVNVKQNDVDVLGLPP